MSHRILTWPPSDALDAQPDWLQDCDCRLLADSLLKPPAVQIARLLRQSPGGKATMAAAASPETRIMQCIDSRNGKECLRRTLRCINSRCDWLASAVLPTEDMSQLVPKIQASFGRGCQSAKHAAVAGVAIQCLHLLKDYTSAHAMLSTAMALELPVPATVAQQVKLAYAAYLRTLEHDADRNADVPQPSRSLPVTQVDIVSMDALDPIRFEQEHVHQR